MKSDDYTDQAERTTKKIVEFEPTTQTKLSAAAASLPPEYTAPAETYFAATAPEKRNDFFAAKFIGLLVLLVVCLFEARQIAVLRSEAAVAIVNVLAPSSTQLADVRSDLASAYRAAGDARADQIYRDFLTHMPSSYPVGDLKNVYAQIMGARYFLQRNENETALKLIEEALAHFGPLEKVKASECPSQLARSLCELAEAFDPSESGQNMQIVLPLREAAVKLWDVVPGVGTKSNQQAALAELYEKNGQYQLALDSFQSAYAAFKNRGDAEYNEYRLLHIGMNLVELGRYEEAERYLADARSMDRRLYSGIHTLYGPVVTYYIARVNAGLKDHELALEYYDTSMAQMRASNEGEYYCWANYYKARSLQATGKIVEAERLYKKTLDLLSENYSGPPRQTVEQVLKELRLHKARS